MPTENEFKFVLAKSVIKDLATTTRKERITQGYLMVGENNALRIRSIVDLNSPQNGAEYYLTYKHFTHGRVIELEYKIGTIDSNPVSNPKELEVRREILDLWSTCRNKLTKDRYSISVSNCIWSVDLFYRNNAVDLIVSDDPKDFYFVLMEAEFEFGAKVDLSNIPFVDHLLFAVPQNDDRFSNTKLSDQSYSENLFMEMNFYPTTN